MERALQFYRGLFNMNVVFDQTAAYPVLKAGDGSIVNVDKIRVTVVCPFAKSDGAEMTAQTIHVDGGMGTFR